MRKKWIVYAHVLCTCLLITLISGCCQPPKISSVPVNLYPQQRDWWCWAACTEMVSDYFGHRVKQCDSANYVRPPTTCCSGCSGNCDCWGSNWGATISDIQNNWTHWNFSYTYKESSLTWEEVKTTVSNTSNCCRCPIYVVTGGHVVVIYGYSEIGSSKYVSYNDPWPPDCEKISGTCKSKPGGEDVVSTYEAFAVHWWATFYNFKYIGGA